MRRCACVLGIGPQRKKCCRQRLLPLSQAPAAASIQIGTSGTAAPRQAGTPAPEVCTAEDDGIYRLAQTQPLSYMIVLRRLSLMCTACVMAANGNEARLNLCFDVSRSQQAYQSIANASCSASDAQTMVAQSQDLPAWATLLRLVSPACASCLDKTVGGDQERIGKCLSAAAGAVFRLPRALRS